MNPMEPSNRWYRSSGYDPLSEAPVSLRKRWPRLKKPVLTLRDVPMKYSRVSKIDAPRRSRLRRLRYWRLKSVYVEIDWRLATRRRSPRLSEKSSDESEKIVL